MNRTANNSGTERTIAQVCHKYLPSVGGIELYVYRLAKDLLRRGRRVDVLTTDMQTLPSDRRPEARYFKTTFSFMRNPFSFGLLKHLRANTYDLLHVHNVWFLPSLLAVLFRKKAKIVVTLHGLYPDRSNFWQAVFLRLYKPLAGYILAKSHKIIVADSSPDRLTRMFKVNPDKIVVIPNGIDLAPYKPQRKEKNILFTGRILPDKNPEILIRAAALLVGKLSGFRLSFVGPVTGKYRRSLMKLVRECGLQERTTFWGTFNQAIPPERERLMAIYQRAYVYVLLSLWEGIPTRLMEAMQFEVPCLAYASGGIRELIRDNDNGLILERLDENLLADKLLQLFRNKALAKRLGRQARLTVKNRFQWPKLSKKILDVYESLGCG